jgi:hypothetical protein
MLHPDVTRTLNAFLPERNEDLQTLPWDGKRGELQTLPYRPSDISSSLVATNPDWHGPLNHYPQPPILDGPFGWPKPDGWPIPERRPGPLPQPQPSPGGKWECKYVNEPKKPDWGGIFDRPTPGNI